MLGNHGNEQMQMVFTNDEFLEVAIERWSEWDLNPRPLNSVQWLKPTVSLYTYISIYLSISPYIYFLHIYKSIAAKEPLILSYLVI